jgi:two-component system, NarL family, response regulator LiaR
LHEDIVASAGHSCPVNVLRLLLVDDHLMLTEALSARLSVVPDLWVVGRCATGDPRLPEMVARLRPDVVTIDPEPWGTATRRLLERLVSERPSTNVVVLTGVQDTESAVDAARAGAAAWVPKESSVEELTRVLHGVCSGHSWFPPEILGPVLRELREDTRRAGERNGPLDALSDRERDVLLGMVSGKRGSQIAEDLMISSETARSHTRSILAKLHVHSQVEAISVAAAAGLRPSEPRCDAALEPLRTPRR